MTHYVMETLGGQYLPTSQCNTIRKLSPRYETLKPGDTVTMNFPTDAGIIFATEELVVRAVVKGGLDLIASYHWSANHGDFDGAGECFGALARIYGSSEGDFLAVYFY